MWILERGELRSKSKCLAQQAFYTSSVKNQRFLPPSPQGEGFGRKQIITCILMVGGFFDALRSQCDFLLTIRFYPGII
jgi:hypothetical protein